MTQRKALIIRHVPYEGVAGYRVPIEAAGYEIDRVDVADPVFPTLDLREPDLVIMMGGPMGVYEQEQHPWIGCQLRRLALRLEANRPTLGVCLGAQLVAAAMGAQVFPGHAQEVGFHPVKIHENAMHGPLRHVIDVPVLHWHGDTFTLPEGVDLLASSALYPHQAFSRGPNLLALQFHAEMGLDERFEAWIEQGPDAIRDAGTDAATLRADHDRLGPGAVSAGQALIADWLAQLEH